MKSVLDKNLLPPGMGDRSIGPNSDGGIFDRAIGNKRKPNYEAQSFQDIFMNAVGSGDRPLSQKPATMRSEPKIAIQAKPIELRSTSSPRIGLNMKDALRSTEQSFKSPPQNSAARIERPDLPESPALNQENSNSMPRVGTDRTSPARDVKGTLTKQGPETSDDLKKTPPTEQTGLGVTTELRPLKMAIGGKESAEALIGNNAVLSFVTGRLDRLNPEGIPSIIADSPFLRQAISAGEVSDLMQQKFSVSDLCRLFEVDQKVINKAAINGLDSGLLVTPKEFLSAIGVDPGRVATELTLLQQNLPVDGVKPYIERAKAMSLASSRKIKAEAEALDSEENSLILDTKTKTSQGFSPIDQPRDQSAAKFGDDISAQDEILAATLAGNSFGEGAGLASAANKSNGQSSKSLSRKSSGSDAMVSGLYETRGQRNPLSQSENNRPQSNESNLLDSLLASKFSGPQETTPSTESTQPSISMNIVASASEHGALSRDLFSDLGQELAAFDVKTTQYAPTNVGASMNSMEEQLAAAGFRVQTSELAYGAQGTKSGTANNHNTILEHSLTWNPELNSEVFSRDLKNDSASQPANRADQARELVILGQERNYLNTMGEQVSSIVVAAPDYSKSFSQNSSSFQDNLSEQESNGEEKAAVFDPRVSAANGSLTGALGSIKEQGFVSTLSEAAGPQEPKSGDIHNKILQHASLLLKDGGGSMRMDIHTPNLGKIDLAINLNNNQLDVRILTASDQSRDMINRELTGLRDGLGQQGISLRTVEIGNANQSSQHFGGNTFAQGRQGQQTSYNEMKEYSKSFANTFTSSRESLSMPKAPEFRGQIPSSWMNSAHASSRIAVRI